LDFFETLLKAEADAQKAKEKDSQIPTPILLNKIEDLRENLNKIQTSLLIKEKERNTISVWGDFSYANIERLQKAGYEVSFFTCPASRYDEKWEKEYNAMIISSLYSTVYFLTITRAGAVITFDAERAKMPQKDYKQLCEVITQENKQKEAIEAELLELAEVYTQPLQQALTEIENETAWNYMQIQADPKAGDKLMLLEGWIPATDSAGLTQSLDEAGYYFRQLEITDEDEIPITIKNNKFSKLFEPITRLYSLPNYKEFDPTPLFAPFFMFFFGLCLGDAGYALLLIAAAFILKPRLSESMKPFATLVLYFGITTFVVGIITGSCFGIDLVKIESLTAVKHYFIQGQSLMIIAVVIGFIHVLYAKFISALTIKIQRGFKYSLSSFAWVFVIFALGCVLAMPAADIVLPVPVEYFLIGIAIISGAIALFYNTPGKNIFLNFGSGLWITYNTVSGLIGDVLSYIRLYAIGLTSALLGGVFNTLAIDMTASINPWIRWLPFLFILLFGHGLNILLSLISSVVHPLRLIYVEYYKNVGFEGGGLEYKPFKKIEN
jgi:V/A-type H+-transporting ATPase subunit I